jgi:hypothetical protein
MMKNSTPTKAELRMQIAALQERLTLLDEMARGWLQPDHPLRVEIGRPVCVYDVHTSPPHKTWSGK